MKKQLLSIILIIYSGIYLMAQPVLENHLPPIGSTYMLNQVTSKINKAARGGYQIWDYNTATTSPMYNYSILEKSKVNQRIQDSFPNVTYIEMLQIGAPDLNLNPMVFYQDMGTHIRRLGNKNSGTTIEKINDTLMLFNQSYLSTVLYGKNETTYSGYGQLKIKNKTFDSVAMMTYVRPPSTDTVVVFVQIKPYFHRIFGYNTVSDTIAAAYFWDPSPPPATAVSENTINDELEVYPNPAQNNMTVSVNASLQLNTINLYDVTGAEVMKSELNGGSSSQLNLGGLARGIYMMRIQTNQGILSRKVVLE